MNDITLGQFLKDDRLKSPQTHFCEFRMLDKDGRGRCLAHLNESRVLYCIYLISNINYNNGKPYMRDCPDFLPV